MTVPSRTLRTPMHQARRRHGSAPEREAIVHGFARLRLVGTKTIDGIEECPKDDFPKPLPFPTCVRDLPRGGRAHEALDAMDHVEFSLAKLRAALDAVQQASGNDGNGPRAA